MSSSSAAAVVTPTRLTGPYRPPPDKPDNRPIEIIEKPNNSQASDEGSIPFTRSMISMSYMVKRLSLLTTTTSALVQDSALVGFLRV